MTLDRIAALTIGLVIMSTASAAQSASGTGDQPPANRVVERTYAGGGITPWRVVQTRTASGGREVVVETVESPNVDGRMSPIQETSTESIGAGSATSQVRREVLAVGSDGRRRLLHTTDTRQDTQPNGDTSIVHSTSTADLNGRVAVTSRQVEESRSIAPDVRQLGTTLLTPGPNEALGERVRTEATEHRTPSIVRSDSTESVRDVNGRWQPITTRNSETRELGVERVEEQTVQRPDLNGRLAVVERSASRGSSGNGREDVVIETRVPLADRFLNSDDGLALSERLTRTTTSMADGGRHTVEEVEGRNPAAPGDPLRVMRRTVITVRPAGSDRWITEREVFERDVNGRLQRVATETEDSSGK